MRSSLKELLDEQKFAKRKEPGKTKETEEKSCQTDKDFTFFQLCALNNSQNSSCDSSEYYSCD